MKYQQTLLMLAVLFSAGRVVAPPSGGLSSAPHIRRRHKEKSHWFAPANAASARKDRTPGDGLSVQAWTTTVGWNPGQSAFPDFATDSSTLGLFRYRHEPWLDSTRPTFSQ